MNSDTKAAIERLRNFGRYLLTAKEIKYAEDIETVCAAAERGEDDTKRVALERISRACDEQMRLPYYRKTNPPAVIGTFAAIKAIADAAMKGEKGSLQRKTNITTKPDRRQEKLNLLRP